MKKSRIPWKYQVSAVDGVDVDVPNCLLGRLEDKFCRDAESLFALIRMQGVSADPSKKSSVPAMARAASPPHAKGPSSARMPLGQ